MSISIQSISELNQRAKNVLIQELGAVDTLRFMNQFRAGSGNYTTERRNLFNNDTVKSIVADIKAHRQTPENAPGVFTSPSA